MAKSSDFLSGILAGINSYKQTQQWLEGMKQEKQKTQQMGMENEYNSMKMRDYESPSQQREAEYGLYSRKEGEKNRLLGERVKMTQSMVDEMVAENPDMAQDYYIAVDPYSGKIITKPKRPEQAYRPTTQEAWRGDKAYVESLNGASTPSGSKKDVYANVGIDPSAYENMSPGERKTFHEKKTPGYSQIGRNKYGEPELQKEQIAKVTPASLTSSRKVIDDLEADYSITLGTGEKTKLADAIATGKPDQIAMARSTVIFKAFKERAAKKLKGLQLGPDDMSAIEQWINAGMDKPFFNNKPVPKDLDEFIEQIKDYAKGK